jgi:hypothetical protein
MSNLENLTIANQVEGFNPLDFVRTIPSAVEGGSPSLYLDVKYRVHWFRLKYPLGKISKVITKLDESMAVVECCIYKDAGDAPEAYLANGFGQRLYDPTSTYGSRYLECAETAAIGRALSAAGFNISIGADEDAEESPVDSGVQIKTNPAAAGKPCDQESQPPNVNPSMKPTQTPSSSYTQDTPVEEILKLITVDEAKNVVIPFKGQNHGKTLAQVVVNDPNTLGWIISTYSGPNNTLRAAARKLMDAGKAAA